MSWTDNPTWDTNGGNTWDSDPLKTWDGFFTDPINDSILPNNELEIWAGFSNENILIAKTFIDSIALNSVDRLVRMTGRDGAKSLIDAIISMGLLKGVRNEYAIEYLANLGNISSSLTILNTSGGAISFLYPQTQQDFDLMQKIGEGLGLSSLFFDATGILKLNTKTQSEGLLNIVPITNTTMHLLGASYGKNAYNLVKDKNLIVVAYTDGAPNYFLWTVIYDPYNGTTQLINSGGRVVSSSALALNYSAILYIDTWYWHIPLDDVLYNSSVPGDPASTGGRCLYGMVQPDFDTSFYGVKADEHFIKWSPFGGGEIDLGQPVIGGHTYKIRDQYQDNSLVCMTAQDQTTNDWRVLQVSGGVFSIVATFPAGASVCPQSSNSGAGIYFTLHTAATSYVMKLLNGVLTQLYGAADGVDITDFTNVYKIVYLNSKVFFVKAVGAMAELYYYDVTANALVFIENVLADKASGMFAAGDVLYIPLDLTGTLYSYKAAPIPSTTPVFTFSYDGTLIDLQTNLTDQLGGDTAIINDIEVVTNSLSLAASAVVYTHNVLPIVIPANTSVTLYPILTEACDVTLVLNVTWSATGHGETKSIVQHPVRPTVVLNAGSVDVTVTALTITGQAIQNIGVLRATAIDTVSKIAQYGDRKFSLSNDYITGLNMPQAIASGLLAKYKDPQSTIESMEVAFTPNIEIEDIVLVTETNSGISRNYIVVGITHAISEATATTKLKLIKA